MPSKFKKTIVDGLGSYQLKFQDFENQTKAVITKVHDENFWSVSFFENCDSEILIEKIEKIKTLKEAKNLCLTKKEDQ